MSTDQYRTYDGSNNNLANPDWGKSNTQLLRKTQVAYEDGKMSLAKRGATDLNPREISNIVCREGDPINNPNGLTDFVWAWGQFVDHEIDLSTGAEPEESADIEVNAGDPALPSGGKIPFKRSLFDASTGKTKNNPRQQINVLSAYIDATNVYGASEERANALRTFDGTGRLKTSLSSKGILLPYNTAGLSNADQPHISGSELFVAGDIRCNEHAVLTSLHTLFVREHNRLCQEIVDCHPELYGNDEEIFQQARAIVAGIEQSITYNEFLPILLGHNALSPYTGYHEQINASIANVFSTASYRLGHSMLSGSIKLGVSGHHGVGDALKGVFFALCGKIGFNFCKPTGSGWFSTLCSLGAHGRTIRLRDAFFNPSLVRQYGIEPFLSGLASQVMREINTQIVEDVRSFLFGPPSHGMMLDLAALNIQRGRDHGLPDYNQCREDFGLSRVTSFSEITADSSVQNKLEQAFENVDAIDPWVGCLAEDHLNGSNVGELLNAVLVDQFSRLRNGDRYWFENDPALSAERKEQIKNTRLSDVIRRNTAIECIAENVFVIAN